MPLLWKILAPPPRRFCLLKTILQSSDFKYLLEKFLKFKKLLVYAEPCTRITLDQNIENKWKISRTLSSTFTEILEFLRKSEAMEKTLTDILSTYLMSTTHPTEYRSTGHNYLLRSIIYILACIFHITRRYSFLEMQQCRCKFSRSLGTLRPSVTNMTQFSKISAYLHFPKHFVFLFIFFLY